MIRFWLACTDCFPWRALAFFNDACERALLKRVGGTYRFIHRFVLDYFANLEQPSARCSIDLPPSQAVELPVQHQAISDTQ